MQRQDDKGQQGRQQHDQQTDQTQQARDLQRDKNDSGRQQQQNGQGGAQQQNVYGEGNYAASRQYNDATRDFARSGRVEQAARDAAPRSDADARQMQAAEAEGKRHAKGEDPALNRKASGLPPGTSNTPKPGEEE